MLCTRNIFSLVVSLVVLHLSILCAAANNGTNITSTAAAATLSVSTAINLTTAEPPSSSSPPSSTPAPTSSSASQAGTKTSTGKPEEDDCEDDVAAEPEGVANATAAGDRQGKQLSLGDNDKYGFSQPEPEPESEPNANSGKLTGNSTSNSTAHGSASTVENSFGLGLILAATFLRMTISASF